MALTGVAGADPIGPGVSMDERDYYASLSGLTPPERYSLSDHKTAYFAPMGGELPWYQSANVGAPSYFSLADHEYRWFAGQLGISDGLLTISDLKARFFASH